MILIAKLALYGITLSIQNKDIKLHGLSKVLPRDKKEVNRLLAELKKNKLEIRQYLAGAEMDKLYNQLIERMNAYNGWSVELPISLKKLNPSLYSELTEAEYRVDEAWGMYSIDRFKKELAIFETICLKILQVASKIAV